MDSFVVEVSHLFSQVPLYSSQTIVELFRKAIASLLFWNPVNGCLNLVAIAQLNPFELFLICASWETVEK